MSSNTLNAIDQEAFIAAQIKGQESINRERRTAAEMMIIADEFDGAYVTEAIIQKLQARFPEASGLHLNKYRYSSIITLTICHAGTYDNCDEFTICDKTNRRINGDALRKAAKSKVDASDAEQYAIDRLDETVKRYNAIAGAYAEIASDMRRFFPDLPYADYLMEEKHKATAHLKP